MCAADDGAAPPLHLLQRSERQTKVAAYPWGALHATEHLGPGSAFRQMKACTPSGPCSVALQHQHAWLLLVRSLVDEDDCLSFGVGCMPPSSWACESAVRQQRGLHAHGPAQV